VPGPAFARREGHLIGYARVSTTGQDTTTQEAKFQAGGCTLIRTETVSGAPGMFATSLRRSSTSFALAMSLLSSSGPLRQEHARRPQPRARIGRERRKPSGAGACHRYRRSDGPHGPNRTGHGCGDGALLHPRSSTHRHRRREGEGDLQRPPRHFRSRTHRVAAEGRNGRH
jgi:hypothetical protein